MNVTHFQSRTGVDVEPLDFDTSALPDAYDTLDLGTQSLDVRDIGLGNSGYAEDPTMRMIDDWLRATEPSRW